MDDETFVSIMTFLNALLDIAAGDLVGGFVGWYVATKVLNLPPVHVEHGLLIGVTTGFIIASILSWKFGALSGRIEEEYYRDLDDE